MMIRIAEPTLFVGDVLRLLTEMGDRPHFVYRIDYRRWMIAPVVDTGDGLVVRFTPSDEPTAPPPIGRWSYYNGEGFWGWLKTAEGLEAPPPRILFSFFFGWEPSDNANGIG